MKSERGATKRRHIRDESIIDHLARKLYDPKGKEEEKAAVPRTPRQRRAFLSKIKSAKSGIRGKAGCPFFFGSPG